MWAVVNAGGSLIRGRVASSAGRLNTGFYAVEFNGRDVTGCSYQATIGDPAVGAPASGEIAVATVATNPASVQVTTWNSAGSPADRPFHLAVHC